VATVLGLQGNTTLSPGGANPTNVASMLKHFIGVGDPISGKAKSTSWVRVRSHGPHLSALTALTAFATTRSRRAC
jgi:beta-glucosidase-like glycosyl hydrolase